MLYMAIAYRAGGKDDPDRDKISYTVECKGVSTDEWSAIKSAVVKEVSAQPPRLRNPFLPTFDAKTVHEFNILLLAGAGYIGKKAIEKGANLIGDIVKRVLEERAENAKHKKTVTIYGPDEKSLVIVEVKPDKPRKG